VAGAEASNNGEDGEHPGQESHEEHARKDFCADTVPIFADGVTITVVDAVLDKTSHGTSSQVGQDI